MRKFAGVIVATLLLGTVAAQRSAQADTGNWTQVGSFTIGSGPGQVGYDFSPGDIAHGPQAITASDSGEVYVLDSVNRRIQVLQNGGLVNTIDVPNAAYPRELAVLRQGLFVLDEANRVIWLDLHGKLIRTFTLPTGLSAADVLRLADFAGRPAVWTGTTHQLDLNSLPSQVDLDAGKGQGRSGIAGPDGRRWLTDGLGVGTLHTVDGKTSATLTVRSWFGDARIVGFDAKAQPYVAVEDVSDVASTIVVEQTIRRFDASGTMTGIARVPTEQFVTNPRRAVEVMPDGTLYAMVPSANRLTVYRVTMGTTLISRLPSPSNTVAAAPARAKGLASLSADTLRTRKLTHDRAIRMTTSAWRWYATYDRYSWGAVRDGTTPRPVQFSGVADGTWLYGIPYDWGGFDSTVFADGPGSHSDGAPWAQWDGADGAVNKYWPGYGPLIGNTNGSGYYVGGTAGIDCAGFVYAASGYVTGPKKGTTSLMTGGSLAGLDAGWPGNVQAMNYFASTGHTFFYDSRRWYNTSGFNTLEATTDHSQTNMDGAKTNFRTWGDAGGYQHKSWWQFFGGDWYGLALTNSGPGQACDGVHGQNVWYKFYRSGAGTVTISGISGGDPDLWVYYYNNGSAPTTLVGYSVNGGTTNDSVSVPGAGWYYADIHIDSSNGACTNWTISW